MKTALVFGITLMVLAAVIWLSGYGQLTCEVGGRTIVDIHVGSALALAGLVLIGRVGLRWLTDRAQGGR